MYPNIRRIRITISREVFVKIYILLFAVTYIATELFSFFDIISSGVLRVFWLLFLIVVFVFFRFKTPQTYYKPKFIDICWLSVLGLLAILAIFTPPNNYDSMAYHLARVMHWIQNGNIEHYPTSILRQLYYNPLAEYLSLHLILIFGNDYFVNLIQLFALLGSSLSISLIISQFTTSKNIQLLGGILICSNPMAILEATTTQNDLVATFFYLSTLYFGLQYFNFTKKKSDGLWLVLSLTLGGLVKFSVWIFFLPILIYFTVRNFRAVYHIAAFGVLAFLFFFTPFFYRNYHTFGGVFGPSGDSKLNIQVLNSTFNIQNLYSNALRNLANSLGLPFNIWNNIIDSIIVWLHDIFNLKIDSPMNTYREVKFKAFFGYTEDNIGYFLGFVLSVWALILLFKNWQKLKPARLIAFFCISGFLTFSFLLKYQPMHQRLLLPISSLICVWFALTFSERQLRYFTLVSLAFSTFLIFVNKSKPIWVIEKTARNLLHQPPNMLEIDKSITQKPFIDSLKLFYLDQNKNFNNSFLIKKHLSENQKKEAYFFLKKKNLLNTREGIFEQSRTEQYFANKPYLFEEYNKIKSILEKDNCQNIGLQIGFDAMEYPLWVMNPHKKFEHINPFPELHFPEKQDSFDCLITDQEKLTYHPLTKQKYTVGEMFVIIF
jgi:hypothetical protein